MGSQRLATWPVGRARLARSIARLPWEAVAVGLGLFLLLATFVGADPRPGVTFSGSPFSDEAWNVVNARNLIQLGRWSVDPWNPYLVNLPFSVLMAAAFKLLDVGIIQARLTTIACVSLAATALVWGLRGVVGRLLAVLAGVAFAMSGLILFYGRLAYLEDLVVFALTLGALVLARGDRLTFRWGLVAGLCFAIAIGSKPNAAFPVAGILVTLAVVQRKETWRWIAGCLAAIALAFVAWAFFVWLPNQDGVALDLRIWPQNTLPHSVGSLLRRLVTLDYFRNSDGVVGVMLGPLLALAGAALAAIVLLRKRLTAAEGRLVLASVGWLAAGIGILAVVTYAPNRYAVQDVPPLAILVAVGLELVFRWFREREDATDEAASGASPEAPPLVRRRRKNAATAATVVLVVAALVGSSAPGLVQYAKWMDGATYTLPASQDQLANVVPHDATVAGDFTALLFMKSHSITTGSHPALAHADFYATGVRWYVQPDSVAAPIGVPATAWTAREKVVCAPWHGTTFCLYKVP